MTNFFKAQIISDGMLDVARQPVISVNVQQLISTAVGLSIAAGLCINVQAIAMSILRYFRLHFCHIMRSASPD